MAIDRDQQQERLTAIRAAIEPVLRAHGVELADLAWVTERSGLTLRATIERPFPPGTKWQPELGFGVNLDDCAAVSRGISAALDALEDLTPETYALEVSSPGLDRPLRGAADFARFVGALAKVKLRSPAADGQRVLRGTLLESSAGTIVVLVDGKRVEAPLADVADAQLVFELGAQPKPASGAKRSVGAARATGDGSKRSSTKSGAAEAVGAKRAGGPSAR